MVINLFNSIPEGERIQARYREHLDAVSQTDAEGLDANSIRLIGKRPGEKQEMPHLLLPGSFELEDNNRMIPLEKLARRAILHPVGEFPHYTAHLAVAGTLVLDVPDYLGDKFINLTQTLIPGIASLFRNSASNILLSNSQLIRLIKEETIHLPDEFNPLFSMDYIISINRIVEEMISTPVRERSYDLPPQVTEWGKYKDTVNRVNTDLGSVLNAYALNRLKGNEDKFQLPLIDEMIVGLITDRQIRQSGYKKVLLIRKEDNYDIHFERIGSAFGFYVTIFPDLKDPALRQGYDHIITKIDEPSRLPFGVDSRSFERFGEPLRTTYSFFKMMEHLYQTEQAQR